MQIVIDIPEMAYEAFKEWHKNKVATVEQSLIANGTPLPKGHGDLIDRDILNLDYEVSMADDWKTAHEIANCVKYAPTVIHADR